MGEHPLQLLPTGISFMVRRVAVQMVNPALLQRTVLLGRLKIAQAIQMSEPEWAKELAEIEKDPLPTNFINVRSGKCNWLLLCANCS